MAASAPIEIIDDDDGFDWEAAVQEIDIACATSTEQPSCSTNAVSHSVQFPSTTNFANSNLPNGASLKGLKSAGASKQSTLDKFIGKAGGLRGSVGNSGNEGLNYSDFDDVCGNKGLGYNDRGGGGGGGSGSGDAGSCVRIDPEAAKTWVYPVNVPMRDYQFAITKKALFSNTLVALPTGLGKTLIAAVVMYNYFRWFPDGKIVFAAPSRPLVVQQIEACHNIVGISQEWTIDMTGQVNPTRRSCFWKTKRVFFVTPQVLEKDIQSGSCLVKHLVCLVIDEAHRALGNYSYCVALRELMAIPVQLRILALTATPGSKQQTIQNIINNLHISTLEYRNESEPDVSPYVHNRKLELIEVAMGDDAVQISDLLLQIIGPYAMKLSAIGVLPQRDYRTLSPMELVNARDKLYQAPPPDLTKNKYDEANMCFTALITLYHIRKLLSSHGIRPAYEMLEEKLKEGRFARLMSTNGLIQKVKFSMQHGLSQGAPSPKLSKMLEVLIDHFKKNDPQKSRVIIFSNFRGSVRDIMSALAKIGDIVKATEFIGQSTGKTLKGQTQKVQQAVLEKFRAGRYNVIVATSIGEEGLDIMEVDLVICFDANVSPLRMIQRMGRTGRKHDGRVVILACEGSEIKGYRRKQASSKAVGKHMRNGGLNSFDFHPSPRMVPHMYKPEVQFVEFSIQQFIPRGKKAKDDHAVQTAPFKNKLTETENNIISKYFNQTGNGTWKPSLIAFPQFQAFPSIVHKVMHSSKTKMLIDSMQQLQELSFSMNSESFFVEDEATSGRHLGAENVEPQLVGKDPPAVEDINDAKMPSELSDIKLSPSGTLKTLEKHVMLDKQNATHSYFFGSEFVSIDALGKVMILSVPLLPLKEVSDCKNVTESSMALPNCSLKHTCHLTASTKKSEGHMHANTTSDIGTSLSKLINNNNLPVYGPCNSGSPQNTTENLVEKSFLAPRPKDNPLKETAGTGDIPQALEDKASFFAEEGNNGFKDAELSPRLNIPKFVDNNVPICDEECSNGIKDAEISPRLNIPSVPICDEECNNDFKDAGISPRLNIPHAVENKVPISAVGCSNGVKDVELSPRLTNFIESGVVPESPIEDCGTLNDRGKNEQLAPDIIIPETLCEELLENGEAVMNDYGHEVKLVVSPVTRDIHTPVKKINNSSYAKECGVTSPIGKGIRTPSENLTNNTCSSDWKLNSGDKSESMHRRRKFRRLRRLGDIREGRNLNMMKKSLDVSTRNLSSSSCTASPVEHKRRKGKRKSNDVVRAFIEEEAEISSETGVSGDEENDEGNDSYDDSFIDDRTTPTQACTQGETSRMDMMAIYRRSLLTQSPAEYHLNCLDSTTPDNTFTASRSKSGSSSGNTPYTLKTPQTNSIHQSAARNAEHLEIIPETSSQPNARNTCTSGIGKVGTSKRKFSFYNQVVHVPTVNLEHQFSLCPDAADNETVQQGQEIKTDANDDILCDDLFYDGLDLDAVEAEATLLLQQKLETSTQKRESVPHSNIQKRFPSPTFDLGI